MEKKNNRDTIEAARVIKVSECTGVSARHVRRVINAESNNDKVLTAFMMIQEGENKLLEEVKKLVPFI